MADEIVVVEDGPLSEELCEVIHRWRNNLPIKTISINRNVGLGNALYQGLHECSCSLVARMDSDDIAHPERFAKQKKFLDKNIEIDVVGSWISEFDGDATNIYAYRELPDSPSALASYARRRNPLNHMTVMFRRQAVLNAGSYQPFSGFEDYHLWVRMLLNGSQLANIPEYLVNVRAGEEMIRRRGGKRYARIELELQKEFLRMGFINHAEFIRNVSIRYGVRMMPQSVRQFVYRFLRTSHR